MSENENNTIDLFAEKRFIGTISHVGRSSVKVLFSDVQTSTSGQIGDYIVVACDELAIFGQLTDMKVSEEAAAALAEEGDSVGALRAVGVVHLLTTVQLETSKIIPGVARHPRIGSPVYIAHPTLVKMVAETRRSKAGEDSPVALSVASLIDVDNTPISFTPEMLFGRHCTILGTTGSGKSWSIARLVEETARHRCKVVLFDATGEFHRLSDGVRHLYLGNDPEPREDSTEVVLPYYHLTERDMFAIFKPKGQSQAPKLRAAIKSLKLAMLAPGLALDGTVPKVHKEKAQFEAQYKKFYSKVESPEAHFDVRKLARQIENECVNPNRSALEPNFWGDYNGTDLAFCTPLITRIHDILQSTELSCIFNFEEKPSLIHELEKFLDSDTDRVLRVNLKYLSFAHNAREIVANACGRHVLQLGRNGKFQDRPLLVIVDEAHHFLNREAEATDDGFSLDSFGMIAKEGRKYSLNICLATQRPRDIPESVLSQMGTMLVHRLINDRDRSVVERASSEIDRSSLGTLPTLAPGEAVLMGIDFPVPLSVRINAPKCQPDSKGPDFQQFWK